MAHEKLKSATEKVTKTTDTYSTRSKLGETAPQITPAEIEGKDERKEKIKKLKEEIEVAQTTEGVKKAQLPLSEDDLFPTSSESIVSMQEEIVRINKELKAINRKRLKLENSNFVRFARLFFSKYKSEETNKLKDDEEKKSTEAQKLEIKIRNMEKGGTVSVSDSDLDLLDEGIDRSTKKFEIQLN